MSADRAQREQPTATSGEGSGASALRSTMSVADSPAMVPCSVTMLSHPSRLPVAILAALLLLGLAAHAPLLDAPLLEGAAGKQTHSAMVARNLYRGRATLARPTVDDLAKPGYFVKEAPFLPAATALLYSASGGVHESFGRLLSLLAWLAGTPVLFNLLRRRAEPVETLVGAVWWIGSPLAFVYSRAFMSDAAMVTASLATLLALIRWRELPTTARAGAVAALGSLALLLKPHCVFWMGPAALTVLWSRDSQDPGPSRRSLTTLVLLVLAGALLPAMWYLHAASIHRAYPAAGATRLDGWFDARSLLDPTFHHEIVRQLLWMVFTPVGALLAVVGLILLPRRLATVERALLAWGGGVLLQCIVFDTRMLDEFARGTEYYQLAMVPVAAMLLGRGVGSVLDRSGTRSATRALLAALIAAVLLAGSAREIRTALTLPERYARVLSDCAVVQRLTRPHDELFVLADRGGTILYYCDRRGVTFVPARAVRRVFARDANVVDPRQLADALDRSTFVYVPFPDLLGEDSSWLTLFEQNFVRVPTPGTEMQLYRQPERRDRAS